MAGSGRLKFGRVLFLRPDGALVDPAPQQFHLFACQRRSLGRHDHFGIQTGDIAQQQAAGAVSRNDGRDAGVTAAEGIRPVVQPEAVQLGLAAVTAHAPLLEDRLNLPGEIHLGVGGLSRNAKQSCDGRQRQGCPRQIAHDHKLLLTAKNSKRRIGPSRER